MASSPESAREQARLLDQADSLTPFRDEFLIPSCAQIHSDSLASAQAAAAASTSDVSAAATPAGRPSTYLCGNSLGLQPKRTALRLQQYLATWASQGVQGHFKPLSDSPLPTWLDADDRAAAMMAPIVGAATAEVAVMQTLTANLHLLLAAFYRPRTGGRHKIILERKSFPSDHFAVESQIRHHGLAPETSMVMVDILSDDGDAAATAAAAAATTTDSIMAAISKHADSTAVLLLPGIQFYTGELLDIPAITAFAHRHDIFVIWDLAHAVGNVPLQLHDWGVDAAAWCTYKYLNSGPGGIGGLFVHDNHSRVSDGSADAAADAAAATGYTHRLAGWWGNTKATRFAMANHFRPAAGAAGFQLSNPSILDITALCASLEIFEAAGGMPALRQKSVRLTSFLEGLLNNGHLLAPERRRLFRIITPADVERRGAQLSLRLLDDALLEPVMDALLARSVIVDERRPNVIRVAPAPLYSLYEDCVDFVVAFSEALGTAAVAKSAIKAE